MNLFFSYLATDERRFTLSQTCAKVWRSRARNDTDKDFWFFCRLNFLRAINLSSSFLLADEMIALIPLIVCQNYQSTSFWCWWLFSLWWIHPPLWKWWAQMTPTHFIHFIYFVVSSSCAEPDQICAANRDNSTFISVSDERIENPLIRCKVHGKWRRSCCRCMSIMHIFYAGSFTSWPVALDLLHQFDLAVTSLAAMLWLVTDAAWEYGLDSFPMHEGMLKRALRKVHFGDM